MGGDKSCNTLASLAVDDIRPALNDTLIKRYHNGRSKKPAPEDRMVIAHDIEGITYPDKTQQSPVLYGTSAMEPLIIETEGDELSSAAMILHIFDVDDLFPNAVHVGYGFGSYDANMILKDFPEGSLRQIHDVNHVDVEIGKYAYHVQWIPTKFITFSRRPKGTKLKKYGTHRSVTIYDFRSFFQKPFLAVAESMLGDALTAEERRIIALGKAHRGDNTWQDMPQIIEYWRCEIQLIRRTFEKFRAIMVQAGFSLTRWYGPGAHAGYILRTRGLYPHLKGCQVVEAGGFMPLEVHEAGKRAFAGGHFEPFQFGFIDQLVHILDINNAYPFAISELPSFAKGSGEWVYIKDPKTIEHFGVYHIAYEMPNAQKTEHRPGPLFFRSPDGMVSYPQVVWGWYMSPEARMAINMPGAIVTEGWYWKEKDPTDRPWTFVREMYETRQRLGKDNLLSLPFKLGPNSLYGKLAQVAGWDRRKRLPPKSHALPMAAWVTSRTREMLMQVVYQLDHEDLISVDTDSVTVKRLPENVNYGSGLGEWGHEIYEAFILVQSGLYLARRNGKWHIKSRGLDRDDVQPDTILSWLRSLSPGKQWRPLILKSKSRFVTLGAALRRGLEKWRVWEVRDVEISPSGKGGKRVHYPDACPQCWDKKSPADEAHWLAINEGSLFLASVMESQPRVLPWEHKPPDIVRKMRKEQRTEKEANHD